MGKPLRSGAAALALLVIGAIVGTQTGSWFPLLGIAGLVWLVGFIVDNRWVQEKIPFIRPPDARFRELSAAGRDLREEIGKLHLALYSDRTMVVDRQPWNARLEHWDADYWHFVRKYFYSQEPALRTGPWNLTSATEYEGADSNWADVFIGFLNYRLKILDELLLDLPS